LELDIHRGVIEVLRGFARANVFWTHIPSGEYRPEAIGRKLKGMGLRAGIPDLLLIIGGRAHFLELKRQDGRLSERQSQSIADLRAAGAIVEVAHGLDAAFGYLRQWGAIKC
jgi:hypothetical protein